MPCSARHHGAIDIFIYLFYLPVILFSATLRLIIQRTVTLFNLNNILNLSMHRLLEGFKATTAKLGQDFQTRVGVDDLRETGDLKLNFIDLHSQNAEMNQE